MKKSIELMAPAGTFEALEAAVNAGADAVYLGGSKFGARAFAGNFDVDELKRAIEFAHMKDVRIYVTVNTLIADSELDELVKYLIFLNNIGTDAIIVQDLGVAKVAREIVPDLPLFASTQLVVTDSRGAKFAQEHGFSRVVLARETTLEEMRQIAASIDCEIEIFVHGALCMSYSGQCLMSSLIGARSGNRGQCAQPCRLPYIFTDKNGNEINVEPSCGKYLLSPKDLNTIELIPEFIKAGATSFKIEGRMKRPEYVATVTGIYRQAIDSYLADDFSVSEENHRDLRQIFNRDFTTAYLLENPGRDILSERRPNNRGVQIGRITQMDWDNELIDIKLEEDISEGDEIEVWVSVGGRKSFTVKDIRLGDDFVSHAGKGETITLSFPHNASINDRVFRTFDYDLTKRARRFFNGSSVKTLPVDAVVTAHKGQSLQVIYKDKNGHTGTGQTEFIAEEARKHPLTEETVKKQVERLGDTDFHLDKLETDIDEGIMVPVSEINKARRSAIEELGRTRLATFTQRTPVAYDTVLPEFWSGKKNISYVKTSLTVHTDSIGKAKAAADGGADIIIYGGETYDHSSINEGNYKTVLSMCHEQGKKIYFATPRIITEQEHSIFDKTANIFEGLQPDGIVVSSLSAFYSLKDAGIPLWLDYSLNTFNRVSLAFWSQQQNVEGVTLSTELTFNQIRELAGLFPLECLVQGRAEMMVTKYCAIGSFLGSKPLCDAPCKNGSYFFKDRMDELFPLVTDQFCRMHILNAKDLSMLEHATTFKDAGISRIRIDARYYDEKETKAITQNYDLALSGQDVAEPLSDFTRGHYFRGVS